MRGDEWAKSYVVVGATGDVGRGVVGRLSAAGHTVRSVARAAGVAIDDATALHRTFAGVDGAYLMIPFDLAARDLHARERAMGEQLAHVVATSGVRRVVLLSGLSAPLRTGSSLGAALMEERLETLGVPELVLLRAGFFMENFVKGLAFEAQAAAGAFATPFRSDLPMPMVAADDVAAVAARLLTQGEAAAIGEPGATRRRPAIVELRGAAAYTMREATAVLGAAIGRPHTQYVQLPLQMAREGMLAGGMSASFADAVIETARSFNAEEQWGSGRTDADPAGLMTLEAWAARALARGVAA